MPALQNISSQSSQQDKRLKTLADKAEKKKKELIDQLRRLPNVQKAIEVVGIGRSTYYDWRANDRIFAAAADNAIEAGRFLINDIAEAQLMRLIRDSNLTAIIFWLKSNHPKYSNRIIHEYDHVCEQTCTEDQHSIGRMLSKMIARKNTPKFTADETRDDVEESLSESERDQKNDKRLDTFRE